MDVYYSTRALEKRLGTDAARRKAYGNLAPAVGRRLEQLRAARCLEDLRFMPGRYHDLSGNRADQVGATISGNVRLVLESANEPIPLRPDESLDWTRVTAVRILEVVDYHE